MAIPENGQFLNQTRSVNSEIKPVSSTKGVVRKDIKNTKARKEAEQTKSEPELGTASSHIPTESQ